MRRSFLRRAVVVGAIVLPLAVATAATADMLPGSEDETVTTTEKQSRAEEYISLDVSKMTPNEGTQLRVGESLVKDEHMISPNRVYGIVLKDDCNVVLYHGGRARNHDGLFGRVLWASNTAGQPCDRLTMEPDGNLRLLDSNGQMLWETGTGSELNKGARLEIQEDGNGVLYRPDAVDAGGAIAHTDTSYGKLQQQSDQRSPNFGSFARV